jgi:hypothetical protein
MAVQNILKPRSGAVYLHNYSDQLADCSPRSPPGKTGCFDDDEARIMMLPSWKALRGEHQRLGVWLMHANWRTFILHI